MFFYALPRLCFCFPVAGAGWRWDRLAACRVRYERLEAFHTPIQYSVFSEECCIESYRLATQGRSKKIHERGMQFERSVASLLTVQLHVELRHLLPESICVDDLFENYQS